MTFISYAQNFEDVTLWRALRDVERGFYIDVGAWDPDQDSVTRAFSERGWRGINIEPVPQKHSRLLERRPTDVNLGVAVSNRVGNVPFFEVEGTGLSTFDPVLATRYETGGFTVTQRTVEQTTLAEICRVHASAVIHFLKVDCEGHETAALAGADFTRYRPWVVLVEATVPLTQEVAFTAWEPLLLTAGYRFCWFDGLNRFYIANEQFDRLAGLVARPPNCFDGFIRTLDLAAALPPLAQPVWGSPALSIEQRIKLATRCRDCDDVPKAAGAGQVSEDANGTRVQVMHNGVRLPADGYCSAWVTDLIERCHGHYDPQEERQFHAVVEALPADATMIELGGNWAYHTAWFLQGAPGRRAVVLEPDPANRAVGEQTMALNRLAATFVAASVGAAPTKPAPFVTKRSGTLLLPRLSVPQIMAAHGITRLDLMHCDVQGAELGVLAGCRPLFHAERIGCVFVSTHVPQISGDALTHQRCLDLLHDCGATIEAEYDPWESFSGDGLIFARFGAPFPGWQKVPFSVARHRETLFRYPCYELAEAMATGGEIKALLESVVRGTFARLLFREISRDDLKSMVEDLNGRIGFGDWLSAVLSSPECKIHSERFRREYWTG